jgi:DNA-binding HxlR family transcriptional regulator
MSSTEKRVRDDRVLLDLLSDKWTIHVLGSLCDHDHRRRFNAIRRDVPGISQKSLVQCLRRLEKNGLLARRVMTTGRLGVEYAFTELGLTLQRPVAALFEWTSDHADAVRSARALFEEKAERPHDAGSLLDDAVAQA